jgi:hypothetical protein
MPQRAVWCCPLIGIDIWNPMGAPICTLIFVSLILENLEEIVHCIILETRYDELISEKPYLDDV